MSTCFLPIADDLTVGDEVLAIGTHAFPTFRVVTSVDRSPDGTLLVELDGTTVLPVASGDDVDVAPPF